MDVSAVAVASGVGRRLEFSSKCAARIKAIFLEGADI
jgi:hypothetical protein